MEDRSAAPYPQHWEADVVARDGVVMHVRPVRPDDAERLQEMHLAQSEQSRFFRFFGARGALTPKELDQFTHVDHRERVGFVVTMEPTEDAPLVALGCYDAVDETTAEVAFYIADSQQSRGLGSVLLDHLAAAGREHGYTRFHADVLPTNARMLAVFRDAGYKVRSGMEEGVIEVDLETSMTEKSWQVMAARERHSEARSMRALMDPALTVRVGTPGDLGDVLAQSAPEWDGGPLPPRTRVLLTGPDPTTALDAVGAAGAAAAVLYGGATVTDPLWHIELLRVARSHGMRVLGPASFGVLGADGTNHTFEPGLTAGGRIGVFSQSTRSAGAVATLLARAGVPLASFVSSGHRIDVSGNDAMQWWAERANVDVAVLVLNSIGNPRKFARISRHLATTVPVVCLIDSRAGHVAPPGHVVRTSQLPRGVLSDMLRQAGVIEATRRTELVLLARMALRGLVEGDAVRLLTTTTAARPWALSLLADHSFRLAAAEEAPAACVVVDMPEPGEVRESTAAELVARTERVPTVVVSLATESLGPETPTVGELAAALRALRALTRPPAQEEAPLVQIPGVDLRRALEIVESVEGRLSDELVAELLATHGVAVVPARLAQAEEAVERAREIGYPVVVKATDPALRHRIELGGVVLGVHDDEDVRRAVAGLRARGAREVIVQRMVEPGTACTVQAVEDPLSGPVVSFSMAGDVAKLLDDVAHRIAPLTERDVRDLINEPRLSERLHVPGADIPGLERLVAAVSQLKEAFPDIHTIDLNPVVVGTGGVHVLGARIVVSPALRSDGSRRTLPTPGLE